MRRNDTATWSALALAASLLLHGVFVTWLALRQPRPPLPARPPPIEVAIIEVPPPAAPEPQQPSPPQPGEPAPTPPPRTPRVRRPTPVPPEAPAPREAPPAPAPSTTDVPADAPTVSEPAAPTLLPRLEIATQLDGPNGSDFPVEEPPEGLHAPEIPKDLARAIAAETIGKAKVERGLVHPYYRDLGKTLLKKWDAERAVSRNGLRGFAEQTVERSRQWNKIWMAHAAQFGRSGNPLDEDEEEDRPREAVPLPAAVDQNLAARQALRKQMRQEFRATRKATLRVVQNADGTLQKVELVSPSNDPQIDKEALVDVRAAAELLPPPPPDALGGRTEIASLWQFELIISINPPVPSFSFEFDEALGYIDPRLPLDRRIYKRVRLLAVE